MHGELFTPQVSFHKAFLLMVPYPVSYYTPPPNIAPGLRHFL